MPSISVKVILSNKKEILNWQIYFITSNFLLYEFFHLLVTEEILLKVFINKNYYTFLLKAKVKYLLKDEFVNINIQYKLNKILQTFGNFILFELQILKNYHLLI